MEPIQTAPEWNDNGLFTLEEVRDLIRTPQRTVRDWPQSGVGPRSAGSHRCGRHYVTVAAAHLFLPSATTRVNRSGEDRTHD